MYAIRAIELDKVTIWMRRTGKGDNKEIHLDLAWKCWNHLMPIISRPGPLCLRLSSALFSLVNYGDRKFLVGRAKSLFIVRQSFRVKRKQFKFVRVKRADIVMYFFSWLAHWWHVLISKGEAKFNKSLFLTTFLKIDMHFQYLMCHYKN